MASKWYRFIPEENLPADENSEAAFYPAGIFTVGPGWENKQTWGEAKKQLRAFYLQKAADVRKLRPSDVD